MLKLSREGVSRAVAKLCEVNFLVFLKKECGAEVGPQHHEWWDAVKNRDDAVILSPRDHGKSFAMARCYAIWKAKYDPWTKEIYILGADQDSANYNLAKLKEIIQERPSLQGLIHPDKRAYFNTKTSIKLSNGVIIRAKGYLSPLRGRHPQLIILDDVLNEKNTGTPEQRAQVLKYTLEAVMPMKDKGMPDDVAKGYKSQVVMIGTPQHKQDMYHVVAQPTFGFNSVKQRAVLDFDKKIVLWHARYPFEALMKLRAKYGALVFSKEYQCEPLSEETSIFPPSLFEPLKDRRLSYVNTYLGPNPVYLGADFSVPGTADGDYTVIWVWRYDKETNTFVILNYWRGQPTLIQEQLRQIEYYCQNFNVTLGYLENNLFQRIYAELFKNHSVLPVSGNTVTHDNKTSYDRGVISFRPLFENGRVAFPYQTHADQMKTDQIIQEFNGITQKNGKIGNESDHDDIVMAAWHALCASKLTTTFKADFGFDTIP